MLIPTLRYDDAHAAIRWLCDTLGFEEHAVYGSEDRVDHAQLSLSGNMIMLSSTGPGPLEAVQKPPSAVGGVNTCSVYLVVKDPDAMYARAVAAGAEVVLANADQDYGGRGFTLKDPEGVIWSAGSYDPRA